VNLPRKVIEDYYGVLDYRFTPERKESLSIFFEIAARMGLTGLANGLEFI
jgi:chorismate dehydratase